MSTWNVCFEAIVSGYVRGLLVCQRVPVHVSVEASSAEDAARAFGEVLTRTSLTRTLISSPEGSPATTERDPSEP